MGGVDQKCLFKAFLSYLTWVNHSEFRWTLFFYCLGWGVQTGHYPDHNWLQGLCHTLHLLHKSDAVNGESWNENKCLDATRNWTGDPICIKTLTIVPPWKKKVVHKHVYGHQNQFGEKIRILLSSPNQQSEI